MGVLSAAQFLKMLDGFASDVCLKKGQRLLDSISRRTNDDKEILCDTLHDILCDPWWLLTCKQASLDRTYKSIVRPRSLCYRTAVFFAKLLPPEAGSLSPSKTPWFAKLSRGASTQWSSSYPLLNPLQGRVDLHVNCWPPFSALRHGTKNTGLDSKSRRSGSAFRGSQVSSQD